MVRRTKEEALATRGRILDAAELEFQRRGVARTSLEHIARRARVTRGAIYWHFRNKTDLFNAMMSRVALPLEQEIDRSDDPALDDPVDHMRRSFMASLRTAVKDLQARRVFEIAIHKVEYVRELQGVRDRRLNSLRERVGHLERGFRRATRRGEVAARVPARTAALGLHSLVGGLLQNWMLDPEAFDLERVGRLVIDAYLRGLQGVAGRG